MKKLSIAKCTVDLVCLSIFCYSAKFKDKKQQNVTLFYANVVEVWIMITWVMVSVVLHVVNLGLE